jgi:hypothetical protein
MPSGEWTDGAFPIRRARIVAARLDTYRASSPTASTWLRAVEVTRLPEPLGKGRGGTARCLGVGDAIAASLVCRSSICPSDHVFHPFADIPHGSRSPDRIHNTDGQPLAYIYSRGSEAEARRAKMLTKDEARRIAVALGAADG